MKFSLAVSAALLVFLSLASVPGAQSIDATFQKAVDEYNKKNYKAAAPLFQQVATTHPDSATPLYYQGLCFQQLGQMGQAKYYYQKLTSDFPSSPEARLAGPVLSSLTGSAGGTPARAGTSPASAVSGLMVGISRSTAVPVSKLTTSLLPKNPSTAIALSKMLTLTDEEWKALPDETKVPFTRGTSSHLFLDGYVNGRRMHMMFDTGAENCHFGKGDLAGAGVKFEEGGPQIPVGGVGGTIVCSMMMADVAIGDIKRHIPILVEDASIGFPIVGETFFKEFRYEIDNSQGFIRFIKKPRAGSGSHVYESTDVTKIPFRNAGNNMVVDVKVNGNTIPMFFDTGASSIVLNAMHAMQLGIKIPQDAQVVGVSGAGGTVRGYMFRVERMELGSICKTNVPIIVNDAMTPPLPLLGQPFYKDRRFTIDNDNHVINFSH